MCNPRRIVIHATEQMARAWQAELERTVRLNGTVTGEAHLGQSLASLLSPAALRGFERAVGIDPDWVLRQGAYYLEIPGGTASYHPETGELEFTVQLTEELVGTGTGTAVVSGTVSAEASGAAQSTYTRPGEWGRSKQQAREEADRLATWRNRHVRRRSPPPTPRCWATPTPPRNATRRTTWNGRPWPVEPC
jgi:hypothetical protein